MNWQMLFVFGLLIVSFALMVWERLSLDIIAMSSRSIATAKTCARISPT